MCLTKYSVGPQGQRQPTLHLGYYAPGNSATWQDPNVGIIQARDPLTLHIKHLISPLPDTSPMNPNSRSYHKR